MTMLSVRREVGEFRKRYKWMALFAILCFLAILGRLIELQLLDHDRWAAEARNNITKRLALPATRGIIRDRRGRTIADNRPAYSIYLSPALLREEHVKRLGNLLQLSPSALRAFKARLAAVPASRRTRTLRMFEDVTRDQYAALETHKHELPGVHTVVVPVRAYPFGKIGAHAIGFLNEVSAEDLRRRKGQGYRAGQRIGRAGIEAAWESYLRGHDGSLRTIVDVRGQEIAPNKQTVVTDKHEPMPGRDLQLTLDMELMQTLERAFQQYPSGAAVVVETSTGYVRALFSKPAYDLNEMSGRLTQARARELEHDPFRPLIDKTIYESYFPGSTFKPVSAAAALQAGGFDGGQRFRCMGAHLLGRRAFRCSHTHGEIDLIGAIAGSCNVYFYRLGQLIGLDLLAQYGRAFGLGEPTGIGINTETDGFIPDRAWYLARNQGRYHVGFTLNAAIGQGNTRVTVLQLAMLYAALANGGTLYVPQLVAQVREPGGEVIAAFQPKVKRQIPIDRKNLKIIQKGMLQAVNTPSGTAYDARMPDGIMVAGKTGTAQVASRPKAADQGHSSWYFRRSHAWFAGYAPADDPQLAVTVLVEHGGDGGKHAAPIATAVLNAALQRRPSRSASRSAQDGAAAADVSASQRRTPLSHSLSRVNHGAITRTAR